MVERYSMVCDTCNKEQVMSLGGFIEKQDSDYLVVQTINSPYPRHYCSIKCLVEGVGK
jgi:hypothetical protein